MKKLLVALLALAMLFAFTACDDTNNVKSVDVATLDELNTALAALPESGVQVINITANISDVAAQINVTEDVEINGNNHKISWTGKDISDKTKASAILVTSDSTIKNLTIEGTATVGSERKWVEGEYGIKVAENANVTLENITVTKMNAGIQVQSSTVTLAGTINVDGNAWAGIAVAKETAGNNQEGLLKINGATITCDDDPETVPAIYLDGKDVGSVEGLPETFVTKTEKGTNADQTWYLTPDQKTASEQPEA